MPRPKGSKNKAKTSSIATTDFAALIAEKAAAKDALVSDIAALEENVNNLKSEMKEKKAELKKLDTELENTLILEKMLISRTQNENNPIS